MSFLNILARAAAVASISILAACGGGGGADDATAPDVQKHEVTGDALAVTAINIDPKLSRGLNGREMEGMSALPLRSPVAYQRDWIQTGPGWYLAAYFEKIDPKDPTYRAPFNAVEVNCVDEARVEAITYKANLDMQGYNNVGAHTRVDSYAPKNADICYRVIEAHFMERAEKTVLMTPLVVNLTQRTVSYPIGRSTLVNEQKLIVSITQNWSVNPGAYSPSTDHAETTWAAVANLLRQKQRAGMIL